MISDAIRKQIKSGEGSAIEFKAAVDNFSGIAAAVCAFLNTEGGIVFIGVGHRGRLIGVDGDTEVLRRELEVRLQEAISPKALFTVSVDDEDGVQILTVEVPAGRDLPYVVDGRAYVRVGVQNQIANSAELRHIIQTRANEAERWERRPSLGLELDDLDYDEVLKTAKQAGRLGRIAPIVAADEFTALQQLGLAGTSGLTQGCDVLFGLQPALRHPQCRVRFIRFDTDKIGDVYQDNQSFQGPVFQVFEKIIQRLMAHVKVHAVFLPGMVHRQDRVSYSLDALREGVVNALAHRDYSSFTGGVSVSVFPKRIEIWNSGRLPAALDVKELRQNHPSIPVNPDITHALYLRGLMERTGRGTLKVISACKALGARAPVWTDKPSGVTLTLYAAADEDPNREPKLNERQLALMSFLRPGDTIRVREYLEAFGGGVTDRQVRRDLAQLEGLGLVTRIGQARSTGYRRTEMAL